MNVTINNVKFTVRSSLVRALLAVSILSILLTLYMVYDYAAIKGNNNLSKVDRNKLHTDITIAINNGAELQDIKQIFENRSHVRRYIPSIFGSAEAEAKAIYKEPVSLSAVLKNLKAETFLGDKTNKELARKIKEMIAEHEKSNPFDKLESSQRIHFETIQSKLGTGYVHIQQDVNLIVDEMASKNQLVYKYLGDATLSFRISLIALFIGLIALIPQIVAMLRWLNGKAKAENKTP